MSRQLVVGAGPVGSAIARQLVAGGHDVVLASRSGRGEPVPGASRIAVDATEVEALSSAVPGVSVIYNALNPSAYHRWPIEWPPMAAAILGAAERTGAVLATVSNLYPYGLPSGPMREDTPVQPAEAKGMVRASMWRDALAAHEAGRIRAVEVRAGDYLGAGAVSSATLAMASVVAGRTARIVGSADQPHSWTYTGDVARLVVAAAARDDAHGRVWHVPSNPPRTQRELLTEIAVLAGARTPAISATPDLVLRLIGLFRPEVGAVAKVAYQFAHPFVIDDSAARTRFGLEPAPWKDILMETTAHLQSENTAAGAR